MKYCILNNSLFTWKKGCREKERERHLLFQFTPQTTTASGPGPVGSQEPGTPYYSPTWVSASSIVAILHWFPKHISKELDQKQSTKSPITCVLYLNVVFNPYSLIFVKNWVTIICPLYKTGICLHAVKFSS